MSLREEEESHRGRQGCHAGQEELCCSPPRHGELGECRTDDW